MALDPSPPDLHGPLTYFQMPHLNLRGTWWDIGLAIGRQFKHMVRWTIHSYVVLHHGLDHEPLFFECVDRAYALYARHRPEALEEIRGVAEGADVDWRMLLVANGLNSFKSLSESHHGRPETATNAGSTECSNIMFPTSEYGPLLGGTLDCAPTRFLATITPPKGYRATYPLWPGLVASVWGGMNERGLALAGASAASPDIDAGTGLFGLDYIPPQRHLLHQCGTSAEALKHLEQWPMHYEDNLSLLDKKGNGIQTHGHDPSSRRLRTRKLEPEQSLTCGNLYPWQIDAPETSSSPTKTMRHRAQTLHREASRQQTSFTHTAMRQQLTSHNGNPQTFETICNNGNNLAMIAVPTTMKLWFASRPACQTGFMTYTV